MSRRVVINLCSLPLIVGALWCCFRLIGASSNNAAALALIFGPPLALGRLAWSQRGYEQRLRMQQYRATWNPHSDTDSAVTINYRYRIDWALDRTVVASVLARVRAPHHHQAS